MIITDYSMPRMYGYDLLKRVKLFLIFSTFKGLEIPFIILKQIMNDVIFFDENFQESSKFKDIPVVIMYQTNFFKLKKMSNMAVEFNKYTNLFKKWQRFTHKKLSW